MKNKKGESTGWGVIKLSSLILVVLVVIAMFIVLWRMGLKEKLENFFPDFEKQKLMKQLQEEQLQVSDAEKFLTANVYPTVYLLYTGRWFMDLDDSFLIRWNSNLNRVQIITLINFNGIHLKPVKSSEEWLIDPNSDKLKRFKLGNLNDVEKREIESIVNSKSYSEMLEDISKITSDKKYSWNVPETYYLKEIGRYNIDSYNTEKKTAQELNDLLRVNQGEFFITSDKKKSEIAKSQIKDIKTKFESFDGKTQTNLFIINLEGWYFVSNPEKCKQCICLCSTLKCESEYDVCETSRRTLNYNPFLDSNNHGIILNSI